MNVRGNGLNTLHRRVVCRRLDDGFRLENARGELKGQWKNDSIH
jgi:hypothetical protein